MDLGRHRRRTQRERSCRAAGHRPSRGAWTAVVSVAVLDDDISVRTALRRLLVTWGMDVHAFASGEEFLQALEVHVPDCLILDLQMPHMNGWVLIERLRRTRISLPIVVITATDADEAELQARLGPAAVWLRKPFEEQTLLRAIKATRKGFEPAAKAPAPDH
jgi:FixJ family two-component response regulator